MASDDQSNPYEQPSHWPRMPTGTMRLGPLPKATPRAPEPAPVVVEAEPEPAAAYLPPQTLRGPASILTGAATPLASRPAPAAAPSLTPEPEPEQPLRLDSEPPLRTGLNLGDFDLGIPAPEPEALVVPIAPRRTRPAARKSSPLVPVVAATVVGLAGLGVLAFLMTAGQRAAPPAPAAAAVAATAPPPAAEAEISGPTPIAAAAPTPASAPVAAPLPQRVAATAVRRSASARRAVVAEPLAVPDPPAAAPDPELAGPRITIPMPEPDPAPPPLPAPVMRPPPPGPDQPMATRTPDE